MNAPDAAMMSVVEKLAAFMAGGGRHLPSDLFAEGPVTIIENFAPYLFTGPYAVARWADGMRAHLENITGLEPSFGDIHDFSRDGDDVYFSLATEWSGMNRGVPFHETGGWALVLRRQSSGWRLKGYGWAVVQSSGGTGQNTLSSPASPA